MKYLHLIWSALLRRRARTILTLLSILVAFLLFALLDSVRSTFVNFDQTATSRERILVASRNGYGAKQLPHSLFAQIKEVPGVAGVTYGSYVSGTYQDAKNPVLVEANSDSFFDVYPEVQPAPEDLKALHRTRTGVLTGEVFAKKYDLKVGDKIPLETGQVRKDGSTVWTFDLVGIYRFVDKNMWDYEEKLVANWDYVEEARQADTGTVTYYAVKVANVADLDRVARAIDMLTANSDHETRSRRESTWNQDSMRQDISFIFTSIMGAVFFTSLLLAVHTMTHAVHERIPELAVLKAIGFTGRRILGLVLCESVTLVLLGGILGLVIATVAVVAARSLDVLPIRISSVGWEVWARGLMLAVAIGLIVGVLPALRGMRLRVVDALSGH